MSKTLTKIISEIEPDMVNKTEVKYFNFPSTREEILKKLFHFYIPLIVLN